MPWLAMANQDGEYSTEVPQQTRTCMDLEAHLRTVTCGDGR